MNKILTNFMRGLLQKIHDIYIYDLIMYPCDRNLCDA